MILGLGDVPENLVEGIVAAKRDAVAEVDIFDDLFASLAVPDLLEAVLAQVTQAILVEPAQVAAHVNPRVGGDGRGELLAIAFLVVTAVILCLDGVVFVL